MIFNLSCVVQRFCINLMKRAVLSVAMINLHIVIHIYIELIDWNFTAAVPNRENSLILKDFCIFLRMI